MVVQTKTIRKFLFVAGLLFIFPAGCITSEQPQDIAIRQSPGQYAVRVLLDDEVRAASLKVDSPYRLVSVDTTEVFSAQETTDTINIEPGDEGIKIGQQLFRTKHLIIEPQDSLPFTITCACTTPMSACADKRGGAGNNQSYRGSLELVVNADSNSMTAINNVPLETYLAGVVAAEMPSYWETEALKAQAIAARTYCLYIKSRFGKNRLWDVRTTQANQVYRGVAAETMRTTNAVNSTAGMVLCCEQESGICEQFPAYYSSVCGGHTENAQDVFGESWAALEGVDCPYCKEITRPDLFYWPMAKFDKKYATEKIIDRYPNLKDLVTIEKIEPAKENIYNNNFKRIVSVKLTGSARLPSTGSGRELVERSSPKSTGKTAYLRAEDLRLAIDPTGAKIQSASCTIASLKDEFMFVAGRGFGHGVGLCQYGARQMAKQGKTAQEILNFYYPSSRIKILY